MKSALVIVALLSLVAREATSTHGERVEGYRDLKGDLEAARRDITQLQSQVAELQNALARLQLQQEKNSVAAPLYETSDDSVLSRGAGDTAAAAGASANWQPPSPSGSTGIVIHEPAQRRIFLERAQIVVQFSVMGLEQRASNALAMTMFLNGVQQSSWGGRELWTLLLQSSFPSETRIAEDFPSGQTQNHIAWKDTLEVRAGCHNIQLHLTEAG
eukprot:33312-Rhodomonas_salina.2